MNIKLPVERDSFEKMRTSGAYYIDKAELVYELLDRKEKEATLITRPRRFGKTFAMSMMESFFDISRDSRALFEEQEVGKLLTDAGMSERAGIKREWYDGYLFGGG